MFNYDSHLLEYFRFVSHTARSINEYNWISEGSFMLTYLQTSNEKFATFVSYFIWISDETFKYFLRFWSLYNNFGWWNTLLITFYYFCERVHFFIALMTTNYLSTPHPLTTGILVFFFFFNLRWQIFKVKTLRFPSGNWRFWQY